MTQWHPIFAKVLRPAVEAYYDVQTNVPVSDVPREADIVLLRRTTACIPPFRGLWRHLTAWNVLEFKGPSVTPRRRDVDLLLELGLGVDRRLREQDQREKRPGIGREDVSFWYIANRLGRRFLHDAASVLGALESPSPGLWRSRVLGRLVSLVSSVDLPVEEDTLPMHIVGREPLALEREVARLVAEQPKLQLRYGGWVASLHPTAWKEVEAMARTAKKGLTLDVRPAIESLGLERVIEQVGIDRVINAVGLKEVVKHVGLDGILAALSPAERRELKRRLESGHG